MQASIDNPRHVVRCAFDQGDECNLFAADGRTAAPPAMVPNNMGLISMTFLTVCEAIQFPAVALESVATMIPPLNRNAKVVVPWAILMGQLGLE